METLGQISLEIDNDVEYRPCYEYFAASAPLSPIDSIKTAILAVYGRRGDFGHYQWLTPSGRELQGCSVL
jgi:hypothetical protein